MSAYSPPEPMAEDAPTRVAGPERSEGRILAFDAGGRKNADAARAARSDVAGAADPDLSASTSGGVATGPDDARPPSDLKLAARCLLADGRECPCLVSEISAERLVVEIAKAGGPGERVVVYVESLGRIEGEVTWQNETAFEVAIQATARKRGRLAAKIAWLVRRRIGVAEDRRGDERIDACEQPAGLRTADGREFVVKLIDISAGGAAFQVDFWLSPGAPVTLSGLPAVVVRHFPNGVAVRFDRAASGGSADVAAVLSRDRGSNVSWPETL